MAFKRIGYGQVEPNQLSGIKTGQIFASLPLAKNVDIIQNGEFMYYDYVIWSQRQFVPVYGRCGRRWSPGFQ